ncbi:HNH endonuclease signature motif containing protein [Corynebacterium sp. NPDC060344]|uniref:HNH endonuclease signature motif containing protein n=1 Tax=Corynebacterium sp. NPDC060344 TaxID=3347101 RepID=UPI0036519D75
MAFDHDAADEHDDPAHHHNQHEQHKQRPPEPSDGCNNQPEPDSKPESDSDSDAEPAPPRKRWVTERDEPVAAMGRARNIANIDAAIASTPDGGADVDSHIASIATRLGVTPYWAEIYCDVGTMLARMPRILDFAYSGALPLERLAKIADATVAVSDEHLADVEEQILEYLIPNKEFQALPGQKVFMRKLRAIIESVEPISTPPDEEEKKSLEAEKVTIVNDYACDFAAMEVCLRKDRMAEFEATLRAIRDAKIKAGEDCTLADALMAMSRGDFAGAKVTMNVYADANSDDGELRLWIDGAGWLPKYLTKQWLERCDDVRLSADSQVDGYVPSDAQKARVRARDGGCRFPGCDVPAHRCQIDHVINYDPDAMKGAPGMVIGGGNCAGEAAFIAGDGSNLLGVTATWNLQCLCQHHHNLKTSRHWNAVMNDDGSVDWFDHTGAAFATSVPHGPIAHIKRQTFDQKATRLAKTIRGANAQRMRAEAEAAEAMHRAEVADALANHAKATADYERAMAEFTAGPLNDPDREVAEEARCLADAADDGWPAAEDPVWDPGWEARSSGRTNHSGVPGERARGESGSRFGWLADENPEADAFWGVSPERSSRRGWSENCLTWIRRASIDADPTMRPEPPDPLGPDPTIPF